MLWSLIDKIPSKVAKTENGAEFWKSKLFKHDYVMLSQKLRQLCGRVGPFARSAAHDSG